MRQTRSHIDELTAGSFKEVIDDPHVEDRNAVQRIVFCSGKVAWDAMAERDHRSAPVAVVRVEQLYPSQPSRCLVCWSSIRTPAKSSGSRKNQRTWERGSS